MSALKRTLREEMKAQLRPLETKIDRVLSAIEDHTKEIKNLQVQVQGVQNQFQLISTLYAQNVETPAKVVSISQDIVTIKDNVKYLIRSCESTEKTFAGIANALGL